MRAAVEADLGVTARRVAKRAEENGWNVVGVVSSDAGTGQAVLTLRGRRAGGGRFVVLFLDGSVETVWWWTRQHRAVVKGYREVERTTRVNSYTVNIGKKLEHAPDLDEEVEWTTERAVPVVVSLGALVGVASGKNPRPGLLEIDSRASALV